MTVRTLIDELNRLTKLYDEGRPEVSDKEWDDLYFELVQLEKETGEYYEDSPTQRVNYEVVNELKKVKHNHPMLSLDKTKSIDEIKSFIGNKEYIAMAKMDGLTCSLTYEGGRLIAAETRGNGEIGEDILHNAIVVNNIPNKIEWQGRLVIDGEIVCKYSDFEEFKNDYKNPRNFASGSIRLLDSKECSKRKLSFVAWDMPEGYDNWHTKLSTKLWDLSLLGFTVVPYHVHKDDETTIETIIDWIKIDCKEPEKMYPIDGVVIKYNKIKEYEACGRTDHHFKGGIAYKFYDDEYETKLLDIEWTMGRTGVLTPVAVFEPINIDGTEISRASLHNISIMFDTLGKIPYIGQKLYVYKANMIIPQIARAEKATNLEEIANKYDVPSYPNLCPICGEPTIIKNENNSSIMYCNNPQCQGKLINRLDHFCGKKGLDIKGISKATLEKLVDWGWIEKYEHIFQLYKHRDEWIKKSGFGIVSVDKILNAIEESKKTSLEKVIAAAGIPEIGSRVAKQIAEHYNSWSDFRAEMSFLKYEGIGEVMNNNLLDFDYTEIDYVVKEYLGNLEKCMNQEPYSNTSLEGKTFCITGKLKIFKNRAELTADIENKGGKVVSSISKKVDYLINNDESSTSAKANQAKTLNIKVLTEEEYIIEFGG